MSYAASEKIILKWIVRLQKFFFFNVWQFYWCNVQSVKKTCPKGHIADFAVFDALLT